MNYDKTIKYLNLGEGIKSIEKVLGQLSNIDLTLKNIYNNVSAENRIKKYEELKEQNIKRRYELNRYIENKIN